MDNFSFPLLSLPTKSQVHVLKTMRTLEMLAFSFCSKRTKDLVTRLKLDASEVEITVDRVISLSFLLNGTRLTFHFYDGTDEEETDEFIPLFIPNTIDINYNWDCGKHEPHKWSNLELEFKDWVEHIFAVLNNTKIDELIFGEECDRFDVNSVADALKGYTIRRMSIEGGEGKMEIAARQAVKVFYTTKCLDFGFNPFKEHGLEPCSIQKVLLRNYSKILINFSITFDSFLLVNSSVIIIFVCELSETELNRFLRLWMRGSNPKLEHFELGFQTEKDEMLILDGINYTKISDDQQREFRPSFSTSDDDIEIVRGGYDIKRQDGTNATITMHSQCEMKMFVWIK